MSPGGTGASPAPLPAVPRPSFWELRVPTSPETAEALTNFLWEQGALGVVEEESPGEAPRLRAFYPEDRSSAKLLAAVNEYRAALAALGFAVGGRAAEIGPLLDAEWASAWQQSFPPREIGERLIVLPPWTERAPSPRIAVVIEPGRAFGTGHHGSTEGCLALLEAEAGRWRTGSDAPRRVLDVGTGTGILAIAALKLGAPRVRAIDVDPDAVAAVSHNAALNGCADAIEPALEGIEAVAPGVAFDLVLANLLTHTHLALAAAYARIVAPAGAIVLGGMLDGEDAEVAERLRPAGFTPDGRVVVEGWSSVRLRRVHER
jgi:ribosomal protein L11 methyltransferase